MKREQKIMMEKCSLFDVEIEKTTKIEKINDNSKNSKKSNGISPILY
jgi:hypothetical protein